ncbi:uncharacterized protein BDZ83DRAFT_562 [Colletotrichum acutatum]|uniref:Uncharacterized protein n=1 Tax=Glomerella acutata TaxID=27357 RepID=A0AAD8XQP2_GLOAC|nr:uncharacterized protein BDZ83DRAFT_562 [Colletotrichum acutatum]KAK1731688.1 hypothetical protein BDZ83DRAFT_562 [Colletotrichum acutatum]
MELPFGSLRSRKSTPWMNGRLQPIDQFPGNYQLRTKSDPHPSATTPHPFSRPVFGSPQDLPRIPLCTPYTPPCVGHACVSPTPPTPLDRGTLTSVTTGLMQLPLNLSRPGKRICVTTNRGVISCSEVVSRLGLLLPPSPSSPSLRAGPRSQELGSARNYQQPRNNPLYFVIDCYTPYAVFTDIPPCNNTNLSLVHSTPFSPKVDYSTKPTETTIFNP